MAAALQPLSDHMAAELPFRLNPDSGTTIHDQMVAHLSEEIRGGRLLPGTLLPSEHGLAGELGISRMTVRRVFDRLAQAGLVVRRQGKGTYVAPKPSELPPRGLIGYIGRSLMQGISSELIAHLHDALERDPGGWHLLAIGVENDLDRQLRSVQELLDHDARGIVFTPASVDDYDGNRETIRALQKSGRPFLQLQRHVEGVEAEYVEPDHYKAGYIGTRHLIRLGHERIAFADAGTRIPSLERVRAGYRTALEDEGLVFRRDLVSSRPAVGDFMIELLRQQATGLLACTDFIAMDVMHWCSGNGIRVPEQFAIVGIGDLHQSWVTEPVLTTVSNHFDSMARRALNILIERIEKADRSRPRQEIMDVDLIVRSTCGAESMKSAALSVA